MSYGNTHFGGAGSWGQGQINSGSPSPGRVRNENLASLARQMRDFAEDTKYISPNNELTHLDIDPVTGAIRKLSKEVKGGFPTGIDQDAVRRNQAMQMQMAQQAGDNMGPVHPGMPWDLPRFENRPFGVR